MPFQRINKTHLLNLYQIYILKFSDLSDFYKDLLKIYSSRQALVLCFYYLGGAQRHPPENSLFYWKKRAQHIYEHTTQGRYTSIIH